MRSTGQNQTWKENEKKIKQTLAEQSLTFTDLIKKTGLSRAVINQHLKELVKNQKVVKTYENGNILNVLTHNGRADLGPVFDFRYRAEILEKLRISKENFQETLNPEGFFFTMNNYLDLMLLTAIPIIRKTAELEPENKFKKSELDLLKQELFDSIITLYVSDVAKMFAQDFYEVVLNFGDKLDVNVLMKGLKERMKKG